MEDIATMFMNTYKYAINAMLHPGEATKRQMSVGDALKFYYTLAIIPLVLGIIVSVAVSTHAGFGALLGAAYGGILILMMVLIYIVLIPIGIIINSGFYHLIIKNLFHMYKQDYSAAFTAYTYAIVPLTLVYWLVPIPLLSSVLLLLFGLWAFIIVIIAISNQLAMSRLKALGTILLSDFILGIIVFVIVMLFMVLGFMAGLFSPFPSVSSGVTSIPYPISVNTSAGGSAITPINTSTAAPALTSSANYTSCGSFTLSDFNSSSSISGICEWSGGTLNISIAGGNSGYAEVSVVGGDGKTYFSRGTTARCLASFGSFYAPAQQYTIKLSTGRGGGYCGADVVQLSG